MFSLSRHPAAAAPFISGLLTLTLSGALASAASAAELEEDAFYGEIPVVSTSSRLRQKLTETPTAITIIDRDMIAASGITEISQLLSLVPGFTSYSPHGNQFGVSNRGLSTGFPGDLEVRIDGRSVQDPLFSAIEWSSLGITVEDIEYIEVARGSNAPAYGSNAFLGAVQIFTKPTLESSGLELGTTLGDLDTRNGRLRYSGKIKDLFYKAALNYRHNNGFPAQRETIDQSPFNRIDDSNEVVSAKFDAMYTPTLTDTLAIDVGFADSVVHVPDSNTLSADLQGFNRRKFETTYQQLVWNRDLGDSQRLQVDVYHHRLEIAEFRRLGLVSDLVNATQRRAGEPELSIAEIEGLLGHPDEFLISGIQDALSERYDVEIQHTLRPRGAHHYVWGAAGRVDRIRGEFLLGRPEAVDGLSFRLFSNWAWNPNPHWYMNAGIMLEENDIIGFYASPRLALNYHLTPEHTLRLAATRGNRTPSLLEANQDPQ